MTGLDYGGGGGCCHGGSNAGVEIKLETYGAEYGIPATLPQEQFCIPASPHAVKERTHVTGWESKSNWVTGFEV